MSTTTTKLPDSTSLGTARQYLRSNIDAGATCPCCQGHVQRYRRPITWGMAYAMIALYVWHTRHMYSKQTWCHVENYLKQTHCPASVRGDFSKLRFWGLIEKADEEAHTRMNNWPEDNPKKSSGLYRLTMKGVDFVNEKISVPAHVIIYNNKPSGFSDQMITIRQALKKKFNYELLMKGQL